MSRFHSNATFAMYTATSPKATPSLQNHRNQQISQLPKIQSSKWSLIDVVLPDERSLKHLSTRFLLKIILLLQILHRRKTKIVLKFSRKMKHKNLKLQLSRNRASMVPLAPRGQLIQNLLLQVLGKTSTFWFTRL